MLALISLISLSLLHGPLREFKALKKSEFFAGLQMNLHYSVNGTCLSDSFTVLSYVYHVVRGLASNVLQSPLDQ